MGSHDFNMPVRAVSQAVPRLRLTAQYTGFDFLLIYDRATHRPIVSDKAQNPSVLHAVLHSASLSCLVFPFYSDGGASPPVWRRLSCTPAPPQRLCTQSQRLSQGSSHTAATQLCTQHAPIPALQRWPPRPQPPPRQRHDIGKLPARLQHLERRRVRRRGRRTILSLAQGLVQSNFSQKGYTFLNVDDCWQAPLLNEAGELGPTLDQLPTG